MDYMEVLINQIKKVMEDIEYNKKHNLDNTYVASVSLIKSPVIIDFFLVSGQI